MNWPLIFWAFSIALIGEVIGFAAGYFWHKYISDGDGQV
jgi:hypothetical protein